MGTYGGYRGYLGAYAGYAGYPYRSLYSNYVYGRKKREAEAEADPYLLYANHGVLPYHYNPYVYHPLVTVNKAENAEEAETKTAETKPLVPLTYTYPNAYPYAYHPLVTVKKTEEAETKSAEVKPIVPLTYTYPYTYHPSVYSGHVVSPFLHSVVPSVATKKVEKREAEAAPEAEADPWLYYSNAGYAGYAPYYRSFAGYQPHTYGYNPYAYRYFGYGK